MERSLQASACTHSCSGSSQEHCAETSASPGSQQHRAGTSWQRTQATTPCKTTARSVSSAPWETQTRLVACTDWCGTSAGLNRVILVPTTLSEVMCCQHMWCCGLTLSQCQAPTSVARSLPPPKTHPLLQLGRGGKRGKKIINEDHE